jgi:hypothetical protein
MGAVGAIPGEERIPIRLDRELRAEGVSAKA